MLSRQPHASCAGGQFGSESNWRTNVWVLNFPPELVKMVSRVTAGTYVNLYVIKGSTFTFAAPMFFASPTTLPVHNVDAVKLAPNFPYGYPVDPD